MFFSELRVFSLVEEKIFSLDKKETLKTVKTKHKFSFTFIFTLKAKKVFHSIHLIHSVFKELNCIIFYLLQKLIEAGGCGNEWGGETGMEFERVFFYLCKDSKKDSGARRKGVKDKKEISKDYFTFYMKNSFNFSSF